jgi:hypothetical protein
VQIDEWRLIESTKGYLTGSEEPKNSEETGELSSKIQIMI